MFLHLNTTWKQYWNFSCANGSFTPNAKGKLAFAVVLFSRKGLQFRVHKLDVVDSATSHHKQDVITCHYPVVTSSTSS